MMISRNRGTIWLRNLEFASTYIAAQREEIVTQFLDNGQFVLCTNLQIVAQWNGIVA